MGLPAALPALATGCGNLGGFSRCPAFLPPPGAAAFREVLLPATAEPGDGFFLLGNGRLLEGLFFPARLVTFFLAIPARLATFFLALPARLVTFFLALPARLVTFFLEVPARLATFFLAVPARLAAFFLAVLTGRLALFVVATGLPPAIVFERLQSRKGVSPWNVHRGGPPILPAGYPLHLQRDDLSSVPQAPGR
ncbi:MAG: hypothetical protein KAY32_15800 [Candidatus Eisenbacteria sp.]|nr:hypothetical protein [Candidatus Eisenbacteria bacterium]